MFNAQLHQYLEIIKEKDGKILKLENNEKLLLADRRKANAEKF